MIYAVLFVVMGIVWICDRKRQVRMNLEHNKEHSYLLSRAPILRHYHKYMGILLRRHGEALLAFLGILSIVIGIWIFVENLGGLTFPAPS